ncbi:MAG: hypothetical protein KDJ88_11685 [Bauldia sp.]|nr:hypothetical protein [Bauldia sp.]
MTHAFLSVVIPFDAGRSDAVEARLDAMGNPPVAAIGDKLDAAAFVHFISMWVVRDDGGKPSHIIIEANADGSIAEVAAKLAATLQAELTDLLGVAGVDLGGADLATFLEKHHQPVGQGWFSNPGVNFDGTPGLTVTQIRQEADLARRVSGMLDEIAPTTPLATLTKVRDRLWDDESAKWAFTAAPAPSLDPMPSASWGAIILSAVTAFLWPLLVVAGIVLVVVWILGGFALGAWIATLVLIGELLLLIPVYGALRRAEETDIPEDIPPDPDKVADYMKREGHARQSHLAAVSTIKPGPLRWLTLRAGLWFAGILAVHFSRPGFLGTTGVIHFARWLVLPGSDKLLFTSNYDGVWESYIEDFIEKAREGVTGIWSNTVGFPKSEKLIFKGCADGDRLRLWTRRQQRTTLFWYTAYPDLTLNRIRINAAIRQGIAAAVTEGDAADWLSCFGSEIRRPDALELKEIPTLVFGGLGRLRFSTSLFLRFAGDRAGTKAWLAEVAPEIAYGDTRGDAQATVLGLSKDGLAKLGLTRDDMVTFPLAFQHGSNVPWRASALGDTGRNDPKDWLWGKPGEEVDAVLVLYGKDKTSLGGLARERRQQLKAHKIDILHALPLAEIPKEAEPATGVRVREPFGFADGISQPRIRGISRGGDPAQATHLVEAGEFVIGYPDNLGYLPPSPSVAAAADPDGLLPALGEDPFAQRPRFTPPSPNERRDLGRNGSFLVVRQLEQDRPEFETFLVEAAAALRAAGRAPDTGKVPLEEWIAAKMVGRWKDGSSLVRNPTGPASDLATVPGASAPKRAVKPDNDFLYGAEDSTGARCPLGAHIRRSNPRETFEPGSEAQLAISNRHRILRVGRTYGPDKAGTTGLLFMCLNTDIDRQFGFIQQTWALAPSFHGLESEVDAFVGVSDKRGVFTIPTTDGPIRVKGLRDFVTVKGSAYFFLPGRRAVHYLSAVP